MYRRHTLRVLACLDTRVAVLALRLVCVCARARGSPVSFASAPFPLASAPPPFHPSLSRRKTSGTRNVSFEASALSAEFPRRCVWGCSCPSVLRRYRHDTGVFLNVRVCVCVCVYGSKP